MKGLLSAEAKMALEGRLPEFVAKTLAAALRDRIESNIHSRIGTGPFGQELAQGIRSRADGAMRPERISRRNVCGARYQVMLITNSALAPGSSLTVVKTGSMVEKVPPSQKMTP